MKTVYYLLILILIVLLGIVASLLRNENQRAPSQISDLGHYRNTTYGFAFDYPSEWVEHKSGDDRNLPYFSTPHAGDVLDLDMLTSSQTLEQLASADIEANNCRDEAGAFYDSILQKDPRWILYVKYCSARSERYSYLFKTSKGYIIRLTYHDNFNDAWTQEEKLTGLNYLTSTLQPD